MVCMGYFLDREYRRGADLARISNRSPWFRPDMEIDYSIGGFSQKICSKLNPSKYEKTLYLVVFRPNGAYGLLHWPNRPRRRRLGSYLRQISWGPPRSSVELLDKWVFPKKVRRNVNPLKFGQPPLPSSLSPEWRV